jgi:hypothetical protein
MGSLFLLHVGPHIFISAFLSNPTATLHRPVIVARPVSDLIRVSTLQIDVKAESPRFQRGALSYSVGGPRESQYNCFRS